MGDFDWDLIPYRFLDMLSPNFWHRHANVCQPIPSACCNLTAIYKTVFYNLDISYLRSMHIDL